MSAENTNFFICRETDGGRPPARSCTRTEERRGSDRGGCPRANSKSIPDCECATLFLGFSTPPPPRVARSNRKRQPQKEFRLEEEERNPRRHSGGGVEPCRSPGPLPRRTHRRAESLHPGPDPPRHDRVCGSRTIRGTWMNMSSSRR
ncbi:hypothetical protein F2P81_012814 [Scophthalmus maximus]|uniref:Uncharacterized protein n=1 Tax=Scophthalmus maximus TaxID=52904 RepID=A0A6A4SIQ2_SCOMX|nr:hypothetical protein F2P81_012814 [Scophthalmus maximus]